MTRLSDLSQEQRKWWEHIRDDRKKWERIRSALKMAGTKGMTQDISQFDKDEKHPQKSFLSYVTVNDVNLEVIDTFLGGAK